MQILSNLISALNVRESTKFSRLSVIEVEEHDGDVRFKSGSGNMAVLCMRNASGHNYRNSSVIMDLAMGQIPRSTQNFIVISKINVSRIVYCG